MAELSGRQASCWWSKMAGVGDFVKKLFKKKSCVRRICVRLGMSISSNNTSSWCLCHVNMALQRDLPSHNSFNISSSPYGVNMNIQIIILSLAPKSRFTHWHILWSINHALLQIIGLMGDCFLYTYSFSHPLKSYCSINSQKHFNFTTVSLFHLTFSLGIIFTPTIMGYTQYLPWGKYTNSSSYIV